MAFVSGPFASSAVAPAHRIHSIYGQLASFTRPSSSSSSLMSSQSLLPPPPGLPFRASPPAQSNPQAPIGTRPRRPPVRRGALSAPAPPPSARALIPAASLPSPAPASSDPFADPPSSRAVTFTTSPLTSEPSGIPTPSTPTGVLAARAARSSPASGTYSYAAAHAYAAEVQRQLLREERERRARVVAGILFTRAMRASGRPKRRGQASMGREYVRSSLSHVVELEAY